MIDASPTTRRRLAGLILPLYLPALMAMTGRGMIIPILPLYLREIGLSYTSVSTVLAAVGAGALLAQLPVGALVPRFSQRRVMVVAHLVMGLSTAALGVVSVAVALVTLRAVAGVGSTAWLLSRHSYLTTSVDVSVRGRASSAFGGVIRIGLLIGPVLSGYVASRHGFAAAFALTGSVTILGSVPFLAARTQPTPPPTEIRSRRRLIEVVMERWRGLAAAGLVQFGFIAVRTGRYALLPFLGAALGMDIGEVGVLIAVGSAAELPTVPASGWLMDRFGRVAAISPSLLVLAAGLLMAGTAADPGALTVASAVIGLGNGLGAGTMITIGSDLAPQTEPTGFLSVMGLMRESGRIGGPLVVGWAADTFGLTTSAAVLAGVALATAVFMATVLGDTRTSR